MDKLRWMYRLGTGQHKADDLLATKKIPPNPGRSDNIGKAETVLHKHEFKIYHRFCVLL